MEERGSWETRITPDLAEFIGRQASVFLGTANAEGQPYIQHRGGPPGFLRVLDDKTLCFADFAGNRQYITLGNLTENPKAFIFLIDYGNRQRVKISGEARVAENDQELMKKLKPEGYRARVEQAILFTISAWGLKLSAAHSSALRGSRGESDAGGARQAHRGFNEGAESTP